MCFLPITVSANTKYAPESVYSTIYNVFSVHGDVVATSAVRIAKCESGYDNLTKNVNDIKLNGHPSVGAMQVSLLHGYDEDFLYNPYNNAKVALQLYEKAGNSFKPWKNCMIKMLDRDV